jgi:2-polyprenyl-3-methyl-5-hydroxy-6-metoxy-1,4-benzoquinol methylase
MEVTGSWREFAMSTSQMKAMATSSPLEVVKLSRRLNTRHEAVLEWCRGPKVLNLGCAQREYARASAHPYWLHKLLADRFPRVLGVDVDRAAVEELRTAGFDVIEADVETMDLGERFDTVVAGELIEHLSNPGAFLDAAAAHLRPGGRLVLTTPNPFALLYQLHYWALGSRARWNAEHTLWMDAVVARQMLARHGFTVIATEAATDYLTRPGPRYHLFLAAARALEPVLPIAVLTRLFANNVVVVAEPAQTGAGRASRPGAAADA